MPTGEQIALYTYYSFVGCIFFILCVSTVIWTFRVYCLGHFPESRPKWLKRPIREMLHARRAS